jgi:sigma-B regulation protein RsbU (phosphoserine phosphatase)
LPTSPARACRPIVGALDRLNQIFLDNLPSNSYFTLFYGVFDVGASRLTWANAAHLPVLHLEARSGAVTWLDSTGGAVGLLPGTTYETRELAFAPGDVFVFYTDGITEAGGPADEEFGRDRLAAVVRERRDQPAAGIVAAIHDAVDVFRADGAAADDATVIVVRIPEGAEAGA